MIKSLIKLANHLDGLGYVKEADFVDSIIRSAKKESDPKLDEPGDEDRDINNDGVEDEQDEYLKNRRDAIGKAIKDN